MIEIKAKITGLDFYNEMRVKHLNAPARAQLLKEALTEGAYVALPAVRARAPAQEWLARGGIACYGSDPTITRALPRWYCKLIPISYPTGYYPQWQNLGGTTPRMASEPRGKNTAGRKLMPRTAGFMEHGVAGVADAIDAAIAKVCVIGLDKAFRGGRGNVMSSIAQAIFNRLSTDAAILAVVPIEQMSTHYIDCRPFRSSYTPLMDEIPLHTHDGPDAVLPAAAHGELHVPLHGAMRGRSASWYGLRARSGRVVLGRARLYKK